MTYPITMLRRLFLLLAASVAFQACSSDDNVAIIPPPPPPPPVMAGFDITVINLTNAQPLSPIAVIAHSPDYSVFAIGSASSAGLEELAEGGDNSALLAEADADAAVIVTESGAGPIAPAGSETVSIEFLASELPALQLSVTTMLVNTNDAFASSKAELEGMAVGDVLILNGVAYDAGTEADTESAADIPGPAGGGTGFDAARDDQADLVTMHNGVVSQDDGLTTSDLTEQHRFDNPVARFRIERIN